MLAEHTNTYYTHTWQKRSSVFQFSPRGLEERSPLNEKINVHSQSSSDQKTLVNALTEARTRTDTLNVFTLINCLQNMYNFNKHAKLLSFKFAYMDVRVCVFTSGVGKRYFFFAQPVDLIRFHSIAICLSNAYKMHFVAQ